MPNDQEQVYDIRSDCPKFERTIIWSDGSEYRIREIEDLSCPEFVSMVTDEEKFAGGSAAESTTALRRFK